MTAGGMGAGQGPGDLREPEDDAAKREDTERAVAEETATAAGTIDGPGAGTTCGVTRGGSEAEDGPCRGVDFPDTPFLKMKHHQLPLHWIRLKTMLTRMFDGSHCRRRNHSSSGNSGSNHHEHNHTPGRRRYRRSYNPRISERLQLTQRNWHQRGEAGKGRRRLSHLSHCKESFST